MGGARSVAARAAADAAGALCPRQREKPDERTARRSAARPELDPQGSLVDADMGAYYTWLNQQRLSGAEKARFLAWFERPREAVAIGPPCRVGRKATVL